MTIYECREIARAALLELETSGKGDEMIGALMVFDRIDKAIRESENSPILNRIASWRERFSLSDDQITDALRNEFVTKVPTQIAEFNPNGGVDAPKGPRTC